MSETHAPAPRPHSCAPREGGREGGRPRGGPGGPRWRVRAGSKRQFFRKKKVCRFCVEKIDFIDYKRVEMLQPFLQDRGKVLHTAA